ncbi:hypothetical protein [Rhizobium sp. PL01]
MHGLIGENGAGKSTQIKNSVRNREAGFWGNHFCR